MTLGLGSRFKAIWCNCYAYMCQYVVAYDIILTMGIARILELVVRTTSCDKGDIKWQWWHHKGHSFFVPTFVAIYMYVASRWRQFVGARTSNVSIRLVNCPIIVLCVDYLKTFVSVYVSSVWFNGSKVDQLIQSTKEAVGTTVWDKSINYQAK